MRVQGDEFGVGLGAEVDGLRLPRRRPLEAVDAAVGALPGVVARGVAVLVVAPVDDVGRTVGTVLQVNAEESGVGREHHVEAGVEGLVAGTGADVVLLVDLLAVQVEREEILAVDLGPVVAEVDHRADVRVAAVDRRRAGLAGAALAAVVARGRRHEILQVRREVGAVVRHEGRVIGVGLVPEVRIADDLRRATAAVETAAVRDEEMAGLVEVDAPLVAAAGGEDLELVAHGMIAPDAGAQRDALGVRRAGFADVGAGEHALVAVEPAVRTPEEAVQRLVRVLVTPAVEQHLGRAVGFVIVVAVGNEEQLGRGADPDAAEADLDATDEIEALRENLLRFEDAVAIGVLEDEDAVLALAGGLFVRVAVGFRDPDAAAVVEREGDRLVDVGFGRDEFRLEAGLDLHLAHDLLRVEVGYGGRLGRVGLELPEHRALVLALADRRAGGEVGRTVEEDEVVEIEVRDIAGGGAVGEADEHLPAERAAAIDHLAAHRPRLAGAGRRVDDGTGRGVDEFDAGLVDVIAAADQVACPRMRDLESWRGEHTGARRSGMLAGSDPEIADGVGGQVLAPARGVRFPEADGLAVPGVALGLPACERAGFETEVERLAVESHRGDRGRRECGGDSRGIGRRRQRGAAEVDELDVAELDFRRAFAGMQLEAELAGEARVAGLHVVEDGEEGAVDPDLDVRGARGDAVVVPFAPLEEALETFRGREVVDPFATVGGNRHARAALDEQGTAFLIIDAAEPLRAVVEVGLVALRVAVGTAQRTELDAGIGRRVAGEAELEVEFEVVQLAVPEEEFVALERFAGADLAGEGAVLDAPRGGAARPALQRAAVEERLRGGQVGAQGRHDQQTREENDGNGFHGVERETKRKVPRLLTLSRSGRRSPLTSRTARYVPTPEASSTRRGSKVT